MRPTQQIIFDKLNETRHTTCHTQQLDIFQNTPTPHPSVEYWHYSDLHNLFGELDFPTNPRPHKAQSHTWECIYTPEKAHNTTDVKNTLYQQHAQTTEHSFFLNGTHFQKAQDLKLSRYACWCLSRNNPTLTFARTYFLAPVLMETPTLKKIHDYSYQFSRIHLRETLKQYERNLSGILNKYHADFSRFNHSTTMAFFYGYSAKDLKERYNIPVLSNDPIANYMGAASLYARIVALATTINRFNASATKNADTIYSILNQELINQRVQMLKNYGIAPEQDIYKTSAAKVQSKLKAAEKQFIAKYKDQKLR